MKRIISVIVICSVIICQLINFSVFANDNIINVLPSEDTYTDESKPNYSFYAEDHILVGGEKRNIKKGYVSFKMSDAVYNNDDAISICIKPDQIVTQKEKAVLSVYASPLHDWSQADLTAAKVQATGALIGQIELIENQTASLNVSDYVKKNISLRKNISFILAEATTTNSLYKIPVKDGIVLKIDKTEIPVVEKKGEVVILEKVEETDENEKVKDKKLKWPSPPEIENVDKYTTTRYKPWMVNYHVTEPAQVSRKYIGGDNGQHHPAIAIAPTNPNIMLFGGDCSGIYRSEDAGATWFPSGTGHESMAVPAIKFHPDNENIVFALACTVAGGSRVHDGVGLYKSVDSGKTWKFIYSMPCYYSGMTCVTQIDFSEKDEKGNRKIFVGSQVSGLYTSDDGGDTWRALAFEDRRVRFTVYDNKELIVSVDQEGLFVSKDKGNTWETRNKGLEFVEIEDPTYKYVKFQNSVNGLVVNPQNPDNWFCDFNSFLYVSYNRGDTWEKLKSHKEIGITEIPLAALYICAPREGGNPTLYIIGQACQNNVRYSNDLGNTFNKPKIHNKLGMLEDNWGWGCEHGAAHPTDPDIFYTSFNDEFFKTNDGGQNFIPQTSGFSGHRVADIWFNPNDENDMIFAHIDFGFARTIYSGNGEEYPAMTDYPCEDRFAIRYNGHRTGHGIAGDPKNPNRFLFSLGPWTAGIISESLDGGLSWNQLKGTEGTATKVFFNNKNPNVIYAGEVISYDDGKTWARSEQFVSEMSPIDNDIVYSAKNGIFKSTDQGRTWQKIAPGVKSPQIVKADTEIMDRLYVGTFMNCLAVVENGTVKYLGEQNGFKPAKSGVMAIYDVAQDPKNPDHMITGMIDSYLSTTTSGVYESFNHGETWRNIEGMAGMADVWCVEWHPTKPKVYFGTSNGTFVYEYEKYYDMSEKIYFDVATKEDSYAKESIDRLFNEKISDQYHDGYFRPKEGLERIELVKMVNRVLKNKSVSTDQTFEDIDTFSRYFVPSQAAYEQGIIEAGDDLKFNPDDFITYEDVAVILSRVLKNNNIGKDATIDEIKSLQYDDVSYYAKSAVCFCVDLGIIDSQIDFKSKNIAKKEEIATMFCRMLDLMKESYR